MTRAISSSTRSAPATGGSRSAAAASRIGTRPTATREGSADPEVAAELRARLVSLFPPAGRRGDRRLLVGRARGHPQLDARGQLRRRAPAWAGPAATSATGVAASNLAGRTLRDLILGRRTPLTALPWVAPLGRRWEPEPLRWLGVQGVYQLLRRADAQEQRTGRPSPFAIPARLLGAAH